MGPCTDNHSLLSLYYDTRNIKLCHRRGHKHRVKERERGGAISGDWIPAGFALKWNSFFCWVELKKKIRRRFEHSMRKRRSTRVQRGWTVRCSRREKIKWKRCLWDQVKWSGCVRVGERLTYGQSVARAYYHRGGKGRREKRKKKKGKKTSNPEREQTRSKWPAENVWQLWGRKKRPMGAQRDDRHSARDHTHSLLHLKYLISVSFREH